jgi:hypothetical protein
MRVRVFEGEGVCITVCGFEGCVCEGGGGGGVKVQLNISHYIKSTAKPPNTSPQKQITITSSTSTSYTNIKCLCALPQNAPHLCILRLHHHGRRHGGLSWEAWRHAQRPLQAVTLAVPVHAAVGDDGQVDVGGVDGHLSLGLQLGRLLVAHGVDARAVLGVGGAPVRQRLACLLDDLQPTQGTSLLTDYYK